MPGNGKPNNAGQATKVYNQLCNLKPVGSQDKESYAHEKKEKPNGK